MIRDVLRVFRDTITKRRDYRLRGQYCPADGCPDCAPPPPLPRDEDGCIFCAGVYEVDSGENWCRCCGRGHPNFPYPKKEPEMKNVVRVCPTSNGYIVCVDVGPNNALPADAVTVVETGNKNPDDLNRQIGAAVVGLIAKVIEPAATAPTPSAPPSLTVAPAPAQ